VNKLSTAFVALFSKKYILKNLQKHWLWQNIFANRIKHHVVISLVVKKMML